jgi:hypothetical protein
MFATESNSHISSAMEITAGRTMAKPAQKFD